MLTKIRCIIAEEMRASETRIITRLEQLLKEKGENAFEDTFENTANLYIPDLGQTVIRANRLNYKNEI